MAIANRENNQFIQVSFQCHCLFGWTAIGSHLVNQNLQVIIIIIVRQFPNPGPKGPEWPSEPRSQKTIQCIHVRIWNAIHKYASNTMQNCAVLVILKTILKIPSSKVQGCVSQYLVQSGVPAGPNFSKRSRIWIHFRVSFEILLRQFLACQNGNTE